MRDPKLYTRHGRPNSLSDPFHDFTPECLRELISKPDEQLSWNDYVSLLGPHLPAGTYEEVVYFFPRAVDYLIARRDEAFELVTPVFGFASEYSAELARDGWHEAARDALRACLESFTSRFEVRHHDADACVAKGWRRSYFDHVTDQEALCEALCDLVRFDVHADLAEEFVHSLAHHAGNATKAAWFLECARCIDDVYSPPNHPPIRKLLQDVDLLWAAADAVRDRVVPQTASPTYWRDTFAALACPESGTEGA